MGGKSFGWFLLSELLVPVASVMIGVLASEVICDKVLTWIDEECVW